MLIIDAWIQNIKIKIFSWDKKISKKIFIKSEDEIKKLFEKYEVYAQIKEITWTKNPKNVFITWKLSKSIDKIFPQWENVSSISSLWMAWKKIIDENKKYKNIWILEISASWYSWITLDQTWNLYKDNIFINPHCWAWSWINIARILQKLWINESDLDTVLKDYLWEKWFSKRKSILIRADRCWVFASSATISDKNQWIPLENALAVTLKSEVLKACKKFVDWIDIVYLTWGIFKWEYARNCADDYFKAHWTNKVIYDEGNDLIFSWIELLKEKLWNNFKKSQPIIEQKWATLLEYPSFHSLYDSYTKHNFYKREKNLKINLDINKKGLKVNIWLDVWSTMAKIVISDTNNNLIFLNSYTNHWDTIETIKYIFNDLKSNWYTEILVQNIWITWSWRYQVQKVLREIYPHLSENINVLVENYAHARWSIDEAKTYINYLQNKWYDINSDLCILVDVWWEDTKISVVSLKDWDLLDNAMNLKCSAWTWSLMDTLKSLFWIEDINKACEMAFNASKAYDMNATCAVFLMENAKILQAEWIWKDQILASCYWAIVENMARTLWSQVTFPKNCLVLLHWQTMLSDPLPLAVIKRLKDILSSNIFWYVPSNPWHRACFWLINSFSWNNNITEKLDLDLFINKKFEKKLFVCRWAVCWDKNASCNRSMLNFIKSDWTSWYIMLWGCWPVNEEKKSSDVDKIEDYYKQTINKIHDEIYPSSEEENRIIIPRSFAVSEFAYFFSQIFSYYDINVYIDNVKKSDTLIAQPYLNIDTCAPNLWATWQMIRLSNEKHKYILIPQIEFLDTWESSLWRTCTINQWWILTSMLYWKNHNPWANFFVFDIKMDSFESEYISSQIYTKFSEILISYWIKTNIQDFKKSIDYAIKKHNEMRNRYEESLIPLLETAIKKEIDIIIICWREYVLNPWVYDSHAWKLFNEKWVLTIPSYVLNIDLSSDYNYLYWRNPHYILSLVNGVRNRNLHNIIKNPKIKKLFKNIETGKTKSTLWISLVSTFKCWPDTVNFPYIQEITKDIPFLTIQSDAAINELAHLENRVNTYMKQLVDNINLDYNKLDNFTFKYLDNYSWNLLNKETDVVYFPTLNDNQYLVSVMRACWYTCIDNYDDNYDLEKIIKNWRKYVWDTVCAPLAWVFSDSIEAVNDFINRKKIGELEWKTRVFIFDNAWDWPCRQWQYFMLHKLYMHKELPNILNNFDSSIGLEKNIVNFLIGKEDSWYSIGVEEWWMIQAFQAFIIQWVMHSLYMKYWTNCKNKEEFNKFLIDFKKLKEKILFLFENSNPSKLKLKFLKISQKISLDNLFKYYAYWLYNNNWIRKELKLFNKKWNKNNLKDKKIKIHIDGEAYMRVAQVNMIYNTVLNTLWLNKFEISYSPIWIYFEYLIESKIQVLQEENNVFEILMHDFNNNEKKLLNNLKNNKKLIKKIKILSKLFRNILINPLYKAAWIEVPEKMQNILNDAKRIIPTLKPMWELSPYVWEAIHKLENKTDLFLNISPEWCMVSTMWEILSPVILNETVKKRKKTSRIETLLSQNWEVDESKIKFALLKIMWPEKFYSKNL